METIDVPNKAKKQLPKHAGLSMSKTDLIIPDIKAVSVYTSPKNGTICTDDDLIQAAPVLPDMAFSVAEVFKNLNA
ncbi:hypothetical protein [Larkinella rosea]|uniref:Uncharacterized protein n=1 Tax=Larkinella rosea TaxID=2025312 RepID=A0A3P1C0W7_9BACT|nr:hypothetical protein [Larkinella rosea]RRB06703.1 hypothetical protein EHT25_02605 [Larkinella rosea]